LQYSKISPRWNLLPNCVSWKNFIHFILSLLRRPAEEGLVLQIWREVHMHLPLTKRRYLIAGGAILVAAALTLSAATLRDRSEPVTLPELTAIHVTLDQALASNQSRPGDHFDATVSEPVVVDGKTVIPQGAHAEGLVVDARQSGRLMGRARLQLALQSVAVDGQNYDVRTTAKPRIGGDHKKRNWAWIGGGAAGGALVGALAGGGTGALIGGPVGAGAGTTVAFLTGKKDIKLRPETPLRFELADPVTIKVKS
jgi:hypothetical protein